MKPIYKGILIGLAIAAIIVVIYAVIILTNVGTG